MSGAEIMAVGGFILALFGAASAAFWRMYGLIKESRDKAEMAQSDLAAHKLHCAETFATKAGMHDQTAQLLRAIEAIGTRLDSRLDSMSERLDRFVENQPARRSTRG